MTVETLLKRYHFKDLKELDEFLRIMRVNLIQSSWEYSRNCYLPSIELLSVHYTFDNEPTPNYKLLDDWINKNDDGKYYKDLSKRASDAYFRNLRKKNKKSSDSYNSVSVCELS